MYIIVVEILEIVFDNLSERVYVDVRSIILISCIIRYFVMPFMISNTETKYCYKFRHASTFYYFSK